MPPKARAKGKAKGKQTEAMGHSPSIPKKAPANQDILKLSDKLFVLVDDNSSGTIQFSEFLEHHKSFISLGADSMEPERASSLHRMESDEEAESMFHAQDADHNLCLDRDEFVKYMEGMYSVLGARIFKEVCDKLIQTKEAVTIHRKTAMEHYDKLQSQFLNEKAQNMLYNLDEFRVAVEKFLDAKADPNYIDANGGNTLFYAAERADEATIRLLLDKGANPSIHTKDMECAAFQAARSRNLDALTLLLLPEKVDEDAAKAGQEEKEKVSQELVRGMANHEAPYIKDLLSRKADPNFKDQNGWTALTAAAFWGKCDGLEVLLRTQRSLSSVKLRVDGRNSRGRAPIHVAARKGKADLIPLLISAHAKLDIQDIDGWTALHHATYNGQDAAVKALIAGNASIDIKGRNGFTPLTAASLPTRAGNLGKEAMKLLEVPEHVAFGKHLAPILNDPDMNVYDKMLALLELPGVQYNPAKLRLMEQFFPSVAGPSKVRIQKFWECLIAPLLRRLRSGDTDLEPAGPHMTEAAQQDRIHLIRSRWREQKVFVQQWLQDSAGPRPSPDWPHDNRSVYAAELQQLLDEELACFKRELDGLYASMLEDSWGRVLNTLPAEEIINERYCSQLQAHPIPVWVEQPCAVGAFEALRLVRCAGMSKDDDDAVMSFAEFITLSHGLEDGRSFWKNIYRIWLAHYAEAVDTDFQKCMKGVVDRFNTQYTPEGMTASYKAGRPKNIDRIKVKERRFGETSSDTYEGRTVAAKVLDVVRCSICVKSAEAAMTLVNEFFRPAQVKEHKFELVRIINRFSESGETLAGYRSLDLNVLWVGGHRASLCGRPGKNLMHAIVGEVQIVLEDYLAVRKRRHIIYKCSNKVYDWPPEDVATGGSTALTDDDHPMSA